MHLVKNYSPSQRISLCFSFRRQNILEFPQLENNPEELFMP